MTLSLITATVIYTLGTVVLINILEPQALYSSLTPIADAGREFLGWMPFDLGVILIVVAAIAAFASTGNAGIMSASRYPYAMAKDKLVGLRCETRLSLSALIIWPCLCSRDCHARVKNTNL